MGMDMAIDSGIFDFGNIGFLSDLPGIGPQNVKTKGRVTGLCIWVCEVLVGQWSSIESVSCFGRCCQFGRII